MRRGPALALAATLLLTLPGAPARGAEDPYYALIYDFEVAMICGLADQRLYDRYKARRRALEAADGRGEGLLTRVRIRAMAAAEREYDNRGLGGFKPWCANEGRAGVGRIESAP